MTFPTAVSLFVCGGGGLTSSQLITALSRLPQAFYICLMPQGRRSNLWDEVPICSSGPTIKTETQH